jgi:hypothetical protein
VPERILFVFESAFGICLCCVGYRWYNGKKALLLLTEGFEIL